MPPQDDGRRTRRPPSGVSRARAGRRRSRGVRGGSDGGDRILRPQGPLLAAPRPARARVFVGGLPGPLPERGRGKGGSGKQPQGEARGQRRGEEGGGEERRREAAHAWRGGRSARGGPGRALGESRAAHRGPGGRSRRAAIALQGPPFACRPRPVRASRGPCAHFSRVRGIPGKGWRPCSRPRGSSWRLWWPSRAERVAVGSFATARLRSELAFSAAPPGPQLGPRARSAREIPGRWSW